MTDAASVTLPLRISPRFVRRLDELNRRMAADLCESGKRPSRAAVMREALAIGARALEQRYGLDEEDEI